MRTELADWGAVFKISGSMIEATGGLSADENASAIAAFYRAGFERTQQGPTDPTEPCVRRDVVQRNLSRIGDRTHPKNGAALDRYEKRIARLRDPRSDDFRGLVAQPSCQNCRIVAVIRNAQFRY